MKREIDNSTVITGALDTPFSIIDRTTRQKTNKRIENLNKTINHLVLIDTYTTFHRNNRKYILLKCT